MTMTNPQQTKDERIKELEAQVAELTSDHDALSTVLIHMSDLVNESEGVSGFHLNGDIALWDEFDFVTQISAVDLLSKRDLEQQAKGIKDAIEFAGVAIYSPPDDPHPECVAYNEALSRVDAYAKQLVKKASEVSP